MKLNKPMSTEILTHQQHKKAIAANRRTYWIAQNWMLLFSLGYGLYVFLPFLAPVFMHIGWETGGHIIYTIYSFLCHQLPQRSLFFFGSKIMYSLGEIQAAWEDTINPLVLRQFVGNAEMGWKVAWSDRMISMYASILIFAWLWHPFRKHIKPLPWWGLILFLIPMGIDGTTHMVSDFWGIGQGFRDNNAWLALLTNHVFSTSFYAGDALGSFNSWMRWITGILFGVGMVWFGFPYLDEFFTNIALTIKVKFQRADLEL